MCQTLEQTSFRLTDLTRLSIRFKKRISRPDEKGINCFVPNSDRSRDIVDGFVYRAARYNQIATSCRHTVTRDLRGASRCHLNFSAGELCPGGFPSDRNLIRDETPDNLNQPDRGAAFFTPVRTIDRRTMDSYKPGTKTGE